MSLTNVIVICINIFFYFGSYTCDQHPLVVTNRFKAELKYLEKEPWRKMNVTGTGINPICRLPPENKKSICAQLLYLHLNGYPFFGKNVNAFDFKDDNLCCENVLLILKLTNSNNSNITQLVLTEDLIPCNYRSQDGEEKIWITQAGKDTIFWTVFDLDTITMNNVTTLAPAYYLKGFVTGINIQNYKNY